ncbi:MAG: hypothetical protein GF331_17445 [Chitinivibrionales bacterium]|nr:hypothetical protein [Chitinivibrionales bacterium]
MWITNEDTVRNLYSSRDTGRTWTDRSIAGHRLYLVEMLGEGFGVAGGNVEGSFTSAAFLTYNGGQSWAPAAQFPDSVGIVQMVVRPADSTVYIAGTCGIVRSDDLGTSWRTVMHKDQMQVLRGLCFQGPDSGIVFMWHSVGGERVFVTHDGGTTWSDNQLPVCHEVDDYVPLKGVEAGIVLANPTAIFRYQSDSGTVTELSDNVGDEMLSIDFYDGNAGCAARAASLCTFEPTEAYWTSDGGAHWESSSCPVGNPARVMCFGDGVAVINAAQRTEDRGATWEATGIPETYLCGKIPGTSAGVYAATDSGLFVSYDAGVHWGNRAVPYDPPSDLQRFTFADSLVAYALGKGDSCMKRSVDGGRTWSDVACDLGACNPRSIVGMAFADSLHGWLFGGSLDWPMICRTNDGGKTWESATFDTVWSAVSPLDAYSCTVRQLVAADAANAWAVAWHNHVFTTNDSGKHWHEVRVDHCPRTLQDIACHPEKGVWVCGYNNAILHVPWAPAPVLHDGLGRHTDAISAQNAGVMPRLFDLRGRLVTTPSGRRTSSPMLYIWSPSHGAAPKPVLQLPRTTNLPGLEN